MTTPFVPTLVAERTEIIDAERARRFMGSDLCYKMEKTPIWIHGNFAIGNILMDSSKRSAWKAIFELCQIADKNSLKHV